MMHDFVYHRPRTLEELQPLLGDGSVLLAGGQALVADLRARRLRPTAVVDIKGVLPRGIRHEDDVLHIGAGATHAAIACSEAVRTHAPVLAALASHVGDPAVRHRGTLGGALAQNHAAGDWPAAALALDATLQTTRRRISAAAFLANEPDATLREEIILEVAFRVPERATYLKFLHPAQRYAMAGAFTALLDGEPRVAVTGLRTDGATRWRAAEDRLATHGSRGVLDASVIDGCRPESLEADLGDTIAGVQYRTHLATVLVKRAVHAVQFGQEPSAVIVHGMPLAAAAGQRGAAI